MKSKAISVTEAARNFADCINRVHYQQISFVLLKNGKPYARLVPETGKRCSGHDLAGIVEANNLAPDEFSDWHRDLKSARKSLQRPSDRWT